MAGITTPSNGNFRRLFNRFLLTAFVSATAIVADGQMLPHAEVAAAPEAQKDIATLSPYEAAQKDYLTMMRAVQNKSSARLDSMEQNLTAYLQRNDTSIHKGVIVLDPLKFDVARALGFCTKDAIAMLVEEKDALYETVTNLDIIEGDMEKAFASPYGDTTYTQNPVALLNKSNIEQRARIAVIVAMPQHALPFTIPGLSIDETIEYANRHEGWHTLDNLVNFMGIDSRYMKADSSILRFENEVLLRSDDARKYAVAKLQQESLACVGAVGDMIQEGHSGRIAHHVMIWREKNGMIDGWHMSAMALESLQNRIGSMSLAKFKTMDEKQKHDFYVDIVKTVCLSPEGIKIMMSFHTGDRATKLALREKAKTDIETRNALLFERAFTGIVRPNISLDSPKEIAAAQKKHEDRIGRKLGKWDALSELQKTARKLDGKVTPESVVHAYGFMMDGLAARIKKDPEHEDLYRAKMTRLQTTFVREFAGIKFQQPTAQKLPVVSIPLTKTF